MSLENPSVIRVRNALMSAGAGDKVVALSETARSAQEAADALGVELGAIVKSLVFVSGDQPIMALVAGDRRCETKALKQVLGLERKVKQASADQVRDATGFAIGGVSPLGHVTGIPIVIDASLSRFAKLFAAAGHPHCVFPTDLEELQQLTQGRVAEISGR